tara:strand:- start:246 stop:2402 length:2157 start_codon:yes stop_codon:yes gene_type:complete
MSTKTFNKEYLGYNGFIWWMGVVEDNNDPLKAGRIKVRCLEWHSADKNLVPTDDLPWAQVMMPANSSSISGVGQSPTGIQNGSWVVGFFLDGKHGQRPMVMGTVPGIPMSDPEPKYGFNDPDGKYPTLPQQPDTNRLARNDEQEKYEHPNIKTKDESKKTGVKIANKGTTWNEPSSAYSAEYPKNDVYEGSGGVIREYDNTPGNERIHHYHPAGSFSEYNAKGNHHQRIVGDNFEIILGKNSIYVKGDANLTVDGNCHTHIEGNWDIYVGGYKKEIIGGNLTEQIGQDLELTTGGDANIKAGGNMDLLGARIDLNKGTGGLFGGLVSGLAGFAAGSLISNLGGSLMESIGNLGDVISVDAISELGDGTGFLPGTADFMKGAGSSLTSSVSSGFDIGGAFTDAFASVVPSSLSNLSDVGISTVSRGLDILNPVKSGISAAINFAGSNINPGNFLGNVASDLTSSLTGDLSKTFDSIGDFKDQLTSNFNVVNALSSAGAQAVSKAVSDVFDPASDLNGFTKDIFAGNTLGGVQQALLGDSNLVPQNLLNKQFDISVQGLYNAQSLLKSVVDPNFGNLELTDKISNALELDNIVEASIGSQEGFLDSFSSKQLLSVDGLKQQTIFELENRVFNSIRSVDTPNLIDGVTNSGTALDTLKAATERVSPIDTTDGLFTTRDGRTVEVFRTGLNRTDGTPITPSNIREGIADFLEIARAADKNGS